MLFLAGEDGQGLVEYALLLGFVALLLIVLVAVFGQQLVALFGDIRTCLIDLTPASCLP